MRRSKNRECSYLLYMQIMVKERMRRMAKLNDQTMALYAQIAILEKLERDEKTATT